MQRRYFPSILLYSFGLALTLSLAFNGFLLYEQSHQRTIYEYELGNLGHPVDHVVWERQLIECEQANQQKDSLLRQLEQPSNAPPDKAIAVQRPASK